MESEWLRDALRFSLKATVHASSIDDGPGPPEQRDPKLRKLVEGILYSRKFILTYHLVILVFLLIFSAVHWSGELVRSKKRRVLRLEIFAADVAYDSDAETMKPRLRAVGKNDEDFEGTSSSGSSTLEDAGHSTRKSIDEGEDDDEETPLLDNGHILRLKKPQASVISYIKAMLMYQPRPIPFFNKTLPSNGMSLVALGLIALNVFYIVFHINFTIFELFVVADRCGMVFVANLPLLYLLAAKNQPLNLLTGHSYESLNIFHRRLGEILCFVAFLHSGGMVWVWYTLIRPNGFGLIRFLLLPVIMLGTGAFLSYELIYFTSIASFRQRWYELFLAFHVALQVAGLVFVFFHHRASRVYVGAALVIFVVDRLVYRFGLKSANVGASASVMEDGETVKLSTEIIKQPLSSSLKTFGRCIKDGWRATDHVFITVPSIGRSHAYQAHPFTISSAAPLEDDDQGRLDLLVRAQKGFSADLLKKVRRHDHLTIRIDGPYGSSHARNLLEDSQLAIAVAGGSGIAVIWPLVHHLLDKSRSTDTEIAPTCSLRRQKVVLIWVVHKRSHLSWVEKQNLEEAKNNGVEVIIPPPTENAGRPDLKNMIDEVVNPFRGTGKKIRVVASGPDSMGRLVRNTCSGLVREGLNVDVTIEKFGW